MPSKPRQQQRVPSTGRTRLQAHGSRERIPATGRTRSWISDSRRAAALCLHRPKATERHRLLQITRAACPSVAHRSGKPDHSLVSVAGPKSSSRRRFEVRAHRSGPDHRNSRGICAQSTPGPKARDDAATHGDRRGPSTPRGGLHQGRNLGAHRASSRAEARSEPLAPQLPPKRGSQYEVPAHSFQAVDPKVVHLVDQVSLFKEPSALGFRICRSRPITKVKHQNPKVLPLQSPSSFSSPKR